MTEIIKKTHPFIEKEHLSSFFQKIES